MTGPLLAATQIDPADVRPGWVAFAIVVAMGVATYLLWKNMKKRLDRVDEAHLPRRGRASGSPDPVQPYAGRPPAADEPDGGTQADADETSAPPEGRPEAP